MKSKPPWSLINISNRFIHDAIIYVCCFRRTLLSFDGSQIANIAILGPYLYWIDREKQSIERVNKTTGTIIEGSVLMNLTPQLVDIIPIFVLTPEVKRKY